MIYIAIMYYLFLAQHVIDSILWCADTPGNYYEERAGEEIKEGLQQTEKEREWHANDVE